MINATKEKLSTFYSNNLQYIVPFFQRAYVWSEDNWEILWEHIIRIANNNNNGNEHFIGTIITKHSPPNALGENQYELIDGQQRLTTFSLLLKAIATKATAQGTFFNLKKKANELLIFENSKAEKFTRIELSRNDKEYFEAIIFDKDLNLLPNKEHKILECYHYFLNKLEHHKDEELEKLRTTILQNVPVINMTLASTDDEQEIFDTINSLGVRLTTGELLKNFIFSDKEIRPLYSEYWEQVFEDDEEQIIFWNKPKTSGRVVRTNIEVLLYCYLIIQKGTAVELEKLFSEYKNWFKEKTSNEKIAFLKELKKYAQLYFNFPEGTELNEIAYFQDEERFFHIIENLEITTVYPLVLYIYKQVFDNKIRIQLLSIIESYLVRRNVCRLTTKNYNNLFIQIIVSFDDLKSVTADNLMTILNGFTEDTNRFPSDSEFKTAFLNEFLSNSNAREILFCISLYQLSDPRYDTKKLSSFNYSTEHMMPQKWETNWGREGMNESEKINRNKKIKTLGNLTLVTKNLNSSMKNATWKEKKKKLDEYSCLKITTDYTSETEWDEAKIDNRASDLALYGLKIWKDYIKENKRVEVTTINDLYTQLKDKIISFGPDITIEQKKYYTAFKRKSNFACSKLQNSRIKLWLRVPKEKFNDSKKFARDVSKVGHHGTGNYEIIFNSKDNLDYIVDLLKQAYYEDAKSTNQYNSEYHLERIKDDTIKGSLNVLRNSIRGIDKNIIEHFSKYHINYKSKVDFCLIYIQKNNFWVDVKINRNKIKSESLDIREHKDKIWSHIRFNPKTNLDELLRVIKLAFNLASR